MSTKKKQEYEFRFYKIPQGDQVLALLGDAWVREYGVGVDKLHFHNLVEMGYCIDGEGEVLLGQQSIPYSPGMLTVIPTNYPHSTNSKPGSKSYWEYIFFNPEDILCSAYPGNPVFAKKIVQLVESREQCYNRGENESLATLVRMIMEECRNRKNYSGEYLRGLLLALLMEIARNGTAAAERIDQNVLNGGVYQISGALEYVSRHYMENIKSKMLAESCNLSETHFRRLFAEYMNMSPMEYINLVRVQQACEMIQTTRYSMVEVAGRVGYDTISTFNRNFRKIIGTSPYQYKKGNGNFHEKLLNARISVKDGW